MARVLVTGGTGTLGREVVNRLLAHRHAVRILSSRPNPMVPHGVEVCHGDLALDKGLREATAGVHAIIHCASNSQHPQETDVAGTRALLQAASASGSPHCVYMSIVGVDRSPYAYYQARCRPQRIE